MTVDWPACKAATADPEGAFTAAAAEASLVEEVPVATLQRKCCWQHQERKMTDNWVAAADPEGAFTVAADEASCVADAEEQLQAQKELLKQPPPPEEEQPEQVKGAKMWRAGRTRV